MSTSITSGRLARAESSAASPSCATHTRCPNTSSSSLRLSAESRLSSTTSTSQGVRFVASLIGPHDRPCSPGVKSVAPRVRWPPAERPLSCAASRMIPDNLHIGPIPIHIFGIFLALGFLAASHVLGRELERKGWDAVHGSSVIVWAAVGGLVGARLWLVLEGWSEFVQAPADFLL